MEDSGFSSKVIQFRNNYEQLLKEEYLFSILTSFLYKGEKRFNNQTMKNFKILNIIIILTQFAFSSCQTDPDLAKYGQNMTPTGLKVELLQTSYPPFIVGERLNLSFAAGSATEGKLVKLEVSASEPGALGTLLYTTGLFYNWNTGMDDSYTVFKSVSTTGNLTVGNYIDTIAATARYSYVIPATLKGQKVSFTFKASTASTSSSQTVEYNVSNIILQKGITIGAATADGSGKAFFSIADGKAYSRNDVEAGNLYKNIDFVYVNDPVGPTTAWQLNKAVLSPANTNMPAGILDANWTVQNATGIEIKNWDDYQLAGYTGRLNMVDDLDLQQAQIQTSTMMAINLASSSRFLVKSADGKWIAFVWVSSATNGSLTFSMKKYQLN